MPMRRTKRGAERTPLDGDYDVLICGASFAGLAVARELAGLPAAARVLMLDRYEIGERQTSACAAPTGWLEALGLEALDPPDVRRAGDPHARTDRALPLPWTFSTFDYRALCALLLGAGRRRVRDRQGRRAQRGDGTVHTDRGDLCAPLVVDALGWRRMLGRERRTSRLTRRCRAGWRCTRAGAARRPRDLDRPPLVPAGYGWSFPAGDELRIGVGSFDPRFHVKDTDRRAGRGPRRRRRPLPGQLDPAQAARRRPRTASSSPATPPATACR